MTRAPVRSASIRELSSEPLRSEEHTSELQSHHDLVCRLLLEKKKKKKNTSKCTPKEKSSVNAITRRFINFRARKNKSRAQLLVSASLPSSLTQSGHYRHTAQL